MRYSKIQISASARYTCKQAGGGWLKNRDLSDLSRDIILSENGKVRLIIDTKYKILDSSKPHFGVSQGDIYQMFTYAKKFECGKIVLLYPWDEKTELENHNRTDILKTYSFEKDAELYIATVDLKRDFRSAQELRKLRDDFKNLIQRGMF